MRRAYTDESTLDTATLSMPGAPPSTQTTDALRVLRARFRAATVNTVDAFRRLARQLAATPDAPEVVEALRRELHRVHGTAGTYGYIDASRLAAKLEERVLRWAGDPTRERDQRAAVIEHFVTALSLAFEHGDEAAGDADRPVIAFVGIGADDLAALRSEAALRGWRPVVIDAGVTLESTLASSAPRVVVTGAAGSAHVVRAASELKASAIVLVRAGERSELGTPAQTASVMILDPAAGAGAVIDAAEALAPRTKSTSATVLVVDDDESILVMVRYILESDDLHVITLDDPRRVVEVTESSLPSLLLMDIRLGDCDGVEIVRALRAAPVTRDLPIVLFSAGVDAPTREAAYAAGADEFVAKPLVPGELRARIRERLERHRLSRLANGLHPVTALPMPARTAGEGPVTLAALRGDARPLSVATVRADGGERYSESIEWLRETRRVADSIGAAFAGYTDAMALILVAASDPAVLAVRLTDLAGSRPANAPEWRAGIAPALAVGTEDFDVLRHAAEDALDSAPGGTAATVQLWSRDSANLSPDVIVVEDDGALADMLQFALRSTGLTHRVFDNGRAALEAILRMNTLGRRPLLLLDVDLPGLDGYTLHERLRVERPGAFQVVFMTIHSAEAEQIRALRAGALDYILKPLNLRILMAKVPLWVERARRS